jgi:hypothetical protein
VIWDAFNRRNDDQDEVAQQHGIKSKRAQPFVPEMLTKIMVKTREA